MADKYLLRVTAGPSYDPTTHQVVQVNTPHPTKISSQHCDAAISVRIQNYHGLPPNSPPTSAYFSTAAHKSDQYSISFSLRPHTTIPGPDLVFGNDFDHPIRDRIPPGFSTAFGIVKWAIDPGLDGDVYADKPYLYGAAGSSLNVLSVGEKLEKGKLEKKLENAHGGEEALVEGADGDGKEFREEKGMPEGADARKKWFLKKGGGAEKWVWEEGRVVHGDFFNPYLDFNNFALKLPGFSLSILGFLGGDDYLRYVLKNKETGDVLFVVIFTLLSKDKVDQEEVKKAESTQQPTQRQSEDTTGDPDEGVD